MIVDPLHKLSDSDDPLERQAAELFQIARDLAEPTPIQKRRVFRALSTGRPRGFLSLRKPAIILGIVAGLGTAGAATTRVLMRTHERKMDETQLFTASPGPTASNHAAASEGSPAPVAETAPEEPASVAIPADEPSSARTPRAVEKPAPRPAHSAATSFDDETRLVMEAMKALRSAHQPATASRLLDQYFATYPRGALTEDALALQIEACTASHDPRASQLARQYLHRFPRGRFADSARERLQLAP